jgi:hypothetical protein
MSHPIEQMGVFSRWFAPRDDLRTVLGRIEEVESKLRRIEGEWADAYEKLARLAGRIRKRAQRELEAATVGTVEPGTDEEPTAAAPTLDEVSKRRTRMFGPTSRNGG